MERGETWEPSVPRVVEKLEEHMMQLLAMLTEVKEAMLTKPLADQRSAETGVEDPASQLMELAEARARAWQAENAAAEARMADFKVFEESRTSSIDTNCMQMRWSTVRLRRCAEAVSYWRLHSKVTLERSVGCRGQERGAG